MWKVIRSLSTGSATVCAHGSRGAGLIEVAFVSRKVFEFVVDPELAGKFACIAWQIAGDSD